MQVEPVGILFYAGFFCVHDVFWVKNWKKRKKERKKDPCCMLNFGLNNMLFLVK